MEEFDIFVCNLSPAVSYTKKTMCTTLTARKRVFLTGKTLQLSPLFSVLFYKELYCFYRASDSSFAALAHLVRKPRL